MLSKDSAFRTLGNFEGRVVDLVESVGETNGSPTVRLRVVFCFFRGTRERWNQTSKFSPEVGHYSVSGSTGWGALFSSKISSTINLA